MPTHEEMIYDIVKRTEERVNEIDRKLAAVEVRAGFIGAIAGATIFLITKVSALITWISGGR